MEKEYKEEYGDIPEDYMERMDYLLKDIKSLKRQKEKLTDIIHRLMNIKWKTLKFTIYLLPKGTPRPRSGRSGVFYVKGAKDNKKFFEKYIADQDIKLIRTPAKFRCTSYLPTPKSMNSIQKIAAEMGLIYPTGKPDWDNLGKAYCDMIQDYLIYDDSLIVKGTSEKFYSIKPRIEIEISYMDDFDSTFNKNKMKKG